VEGRVAIFLRYYPLKAHTIFCKSKKYMLFNKRCGNFLKKNNHISHPNTLYDGLRRGLPKNPLFYQFLYKSNSKILRKLYKPLNNFTTIQNQC
jgi:hypothetical protein